MNPNPIEIAFEDGAPAHVNGTISRRLVLRLNGEDVDIATVRLDSDTARDRQARRWAETHGIARAELLDKLRKAALVATAEAQAARSRGPKPAGTAESPPPPPHTLDEARPVFNKWLKDTDPDLLDVVFGAVLAHRLQGDPVWLFVVGAPGDGKTECVRSLAQHPQIHTLSTLSPASLISGYIVDGGPDPSLLPKLDGKVLIIKDFTCVLELPQDARSEILGTLRDAYDGECSKAFGTGEVKTYRSRFGLIAAVTPAIDRYWSVVNQLGERFVRIRLPAIGRQAKARRAMQNVDDEGAMRAELSAAALGVLAQRPATPEMPVEIGEALVSLADFVAVARSEVGRDKAHVVQYIPAPEVGTRVGKALKKLAMGIAMARGLPAVNTDVYRIVRRVGLDSIPSMRGALLGVLWQLRCGYETTATIADAAEIPTETAKTWLDDLRLLGIVDRGGEAARGYTWNLRESVQDTIEQAGLWADDMYGGGGGGGAPPTPPPPRATQGGLFSAKGAPF